ncbi:MAG: adenylate/guanylate cyclase domain-containing protein, partial [Fidelibacterota bacterium]
MTDSTNQESTKRKLAAIMFTDIEGFTALSAHDEEKALELIDKQRHILKPIVEAHHGSWLKEMGDGLLLSFPSSKLAVNCAIEIQETLREVDDLNLRIGIHQGDILEKGGDVFGDDVNIASRIEPFAAAGGIAISDKVHRDISSSPELTTKYVGLPRLKGVKQEVKVYCIVSHGLSETRPSDISAKLEKKPASWFYWMLPALVVLAAAVVVVFPRRQEVPSVGILYIENLGTEEDEFWARGITEDVIIELASAGLVRVAPMKEILEFAHSNLPLAEIAKHLRVEYVLTGSIYKREDGFDLRAQLIEAHSGKSIYANKWSEPLKRASTITGTLAENIAESLGVTPTIEMGTTSIASPEAYELYLRGKYAYENRRNADDTRRARDFLKKAIQINSHLIRARLELGRSY